jgi:hypothetical protein
MGERQRRDRLRTRSRDEQVEGGVRERRSPATATPSHAEQARFSFAEIDVDVAEVPGPFDTRVNALLSEAFGHPLDGLRVERSADDFNDLIGARASTVGDRIFLGADVREDPADASSMEVIAHEVAHALAPTRAPTSLLDRAGDVGEAQAHRAGREIGAYVARGATSPVPSVAAASGGSAAVHRFEAGEHKHAVDNAIQILAEQDPSARNSGAAAQLQHQITLENGMRVSPGDITALMGDLYAVVDEDGNVDPLRSFEAMNNAPAAEMTELLSLVHAEYNDHEHETEPIEWETATRRRGSGDRQELSYLELADRNKSHFSGPTMEGTDNNMGTYTAFHQMALQAAQEGDANRARALEASAMHYLTDRHAGGHQFDKDAVQAASGHGEGGLEGILGGMHVKTVHDDMNETGVTVENAGGESWRAYGDGSFYADDNEENRRRTAMSVTTSWNELDEVLRNCQGDGGRSVEEIQNAGYGAYQTVPQFSQQTQEGAERASRNVSDLSIVEQYGDKAAPTIAGKCIRAFGEYVEAPAIGLYDDASSWVGENVIDPIGNAYDTAVDWTSDNVVAPAAEAYDTASGWATENIVDPVGEAYDTASGWVGENVTAPASQAYDDASSWLGDQWESLW